VAEQNAAFVASIPVNYDRYLGPLFFRGYADEMAALLDVRPGMRVLETACGTGLVTERLVARLAGDGHLVATDLNEPMLAHAATKGLPGDHLEWRQADATKLPFADGSFDAIVCQFGMMFFPDKALGMHEAFRVLKPGGRLHISVWDRLADNPVPRITHETVATFFPKDPPGFYTVPFSLHDPTVVGGLLAGAGFDEVRWERLDKTGVSPSAADATLGLIDGSPIYLAIVEQRPDALPDIRAGVAKNLASTLGDRPLRAPLRAVFHSARRPAR
jgi:SAM-dependent methyltransferase